MAEYYNVTTNLGDAEIANAIATNTKLDITHIAFGDGNGAVPTPTKSRTTLVREVHRQAVTKYERHKTNANWIVIETIIPSSIGGFTIREMGVIANGKLISHGSHAPFEKIADPSGVSEYRLRFTQNVTDGSVVEIMLDGSLIYASQAWVEENFIKRNEIVDNLTTDDATKPVSVKQAKMLQDNKLGKTENAASASKLATARTVSFSGAATGSFNFDGASNSSATLTLANSGVVANTYGSNLKIPVLTVNAKGLVTGVAEQNIHIVDNLTTDDATKPVSAKQAKMLQDNKLEKTELKDASTDQKGVVQLNNTLTSTSTTEVLTAKMGKKLQDEKAAMSLFNSSLGVDAGYQKIAGGFIIQWGYSASVNLDAFAVTFPIAFPNKCVFAAADIYNGVTDQLLRAIPTHTTTGMSGNMNGSGNHPVKWVAMGF